MKRNLKTEVGDLTDKACTRKNESTKCYKPN